MEFDYWVSHHTRSISNNQNCLTAASGDDEAVIAPQTVRTLRFGVCTHLLCLSPYERWDDKTGLRNLATESQSERHGGLRKLNKSKILLLLVSFLFFLVDVRYSGTRAEEQNECSRSLFDETGWGTVRVDHTCANINQRPDLPEPYQTCQSKEKGNAWFFPTRNDSLVMQAWSLHWTCTSSETPRMFLETLRSTNAWSELAKYETLGAWLRSSLIISITCYYHTILREVMSRGYSKLFPDTVSYITYVPSLYP